MGLKKGDLPLAAPSKLQSRGTVAQRCFPSIKNFLEVLA